MAKGQKSKNPTGNLTEIERDYVDAERKKILHGANKRKRSSTAHGRPGYRYSFDLPDGLDPVLAYLKRNTWSYGIATLPDGERMETREELMAEAGRRTERIVAELCGDAPWVIGDLCNRSTRDFRNACRPQTGQHLDFLRDIQLATMVHIGVIREHLLDVERDLWITMQMVHDPRVTVFPKPGTARVRNIKWREAVREAKRTGRKSPPVPVSNIALPARMIARLEGLNSPKLKYATPEREMAPQLRAAVESHRRAAHAKVERIAIAAGLRGGRTPVPEREPVGPPIESKPLPDLSIKQVRTRPAKYPQPR